MPSRPWLGGLALVVAGLVYDLLLALLRRLDRAFPSTDPTESTWWFGYARDAVNLVGLVGFCLAFWVLGFFGPLAFLGGFAMALIAYGCDYLIARTLHARYPRLLLGSVLAAVSIGVTAVRAPLARALVALMNALF